MARGRMISRSISTNGQLKRVSLEADFLFGRMIPHLDRDGRTYGDPDVIKATACPLRAELTAEVVGACLSELAAAELIERYELDGEQYVAFPGFAAHQGGFHYDREAESRIPPPDTEGAVRTNSGLTPDEVRLIEVKSNKAKGRGRTPASPETDAVGGQIRVVLDRYQTLHPKRKVAGMDGIVRKALKDFTAPELIEAIEGNAADPWHRERRKHELSYVLRNPDKINEFRERTSAPARGGSSPKQAGVTGADIVW